MFNLFRDTMGRKEWFDIVLNKFEKENDTKNLSEDEYHELCHMWGLDQNVCIVIEEYIRRINRVIFYDTNDELKDSLKPGENYYCIPLDDLMYILNKRFNDMLIENERRNECNKEK